MRSNIIQFINKLNEIKISKEKVEILEHIKIRFIYESDV